MYQKATKRYKITRPKFVHISFGASYNILEVENMYNCNELIGLSILSLYEGELLGKVDKLFFDKKLKKLVELELISENDTRLILPTKNIYHIGKNAITVKNNQAVSLKVEDSTLTLAPLNSKAYSIKGEFLGVIKDFSLNEKFISETFLLDNSSTLDVGMLASCGKWTVIFYDQSNHVNLSKFTPKRTPKIFKTKKEVNATILPVEQEKEEENVVTPQNAVPVEEPKTISQSAEFLIGRVCTKDIFNFNNEVLIKAHAVINKKIINEANRFGKLRELMLYSK